MLICGPKVKTNSCMETKIIKRNTSVVDSLENISLLIPKKLIYSDLHFFRFPNIFLVFLYLLSFLKTISFSIYFGHFSSKSKCLLCIQINQPNLIHDLFRVLIFWSSTTLFLSLFIGLVFTSGFSGRLASDHRKFRENSSFPNSLKVKRFGKFQ